MSDGCYCSACRMPPCSWCTRSITDLDEEELADLYLSGELDLPDVPELTPEQKALFFTEEQP